MLKSLDDLVGPARVAALHRAPQKQPELKSRLSVEIFFPSDKVSFYILFQSRQTATPLPILM